MDGATVQAIHSAKSGGSAVPGQVAAELQSRTGVYVHHARIYTGKRAETLSRKLNAEAFTHGRDIFFDKGAYQPGSTTGKQLLAHELTHVAQQTDTNTNGAVQCKLKFTSNDLDGNVSSRAKRAGKFGFESTFSKIKRYLERYEGAGNDKQLQSSLLTKLNVLIDQWGCMTLPTR